MIGTIIAIGMVLVVMFAVLVFHAYELQRLEERLEEQARLLTKQIEVLVAMAATDDALYRTVTRILNTP
jgi:uncharacterized membrane protein affecting hemolysin expression